MFETLYGDVLDYGKFVVASWSYTNQGHAEVFNYLRFDQVKYRNGKWYYKRGENYIHDIYTVLGMIYAVLRYRAALALSVSNKSGYDSCMEANPDNILDWLQNCPGVKVLDAEGFHAES